MRSVLASNLERLLLHHYKEEPNKTARQKRLAREASVSFSTVQRVMDAEVGLSLDHIESVSRAFGLAAYQLLLPNLNVKNPQVIRGATKGEEEFYASIREARAAAD